MSQSVPVFVPTPEDQTNVCMAYLSYVGESLRQQSGTTQTIYNSINEAISKSPALFNGTDVDWNIVWGPAICTYPGATEQDSGMFVAQQISNPDNVVVAIRGTNGKALEDWWKEDFEVLSMSDWAGVSGAKISQATQNGIDLLLNKLIPDEGLPAAGQSITEFLQSLSDKPVNIGFTGHSLGGALSPTLALWFAERQGQCDNWDPNSNATITCTAFAGATAGNAEFANYSNDQFSANPIRRIHNVNDMVPHAWDKTEMDKIASLYDGAHIDLDWEFKLLLDGIILATKGHHYTQINHSLPVAFDIDLSQGDSFFTQASYQHYQSYPRIILGDTAGKEFLDVIHK